MQTQITREVAAKVLAVVDAGLSKGLGQRKAGFMCVEAAVCYALDMPHGDNPECVSEALRALKINLNDREWSSKTARAKGLRRLAIAQLGSRDAIDDKEFAKRVAETAIRTMVPLALRAAASVQKDSTHKAKLLDAALRCEKEGTKDAVNAAANAAAYANAVNAAYAAANAVNAAAYAANAAAYAADAAYATANAAYAAAYAANATAYANAAANAARDKILSDFAESVVQILIDMKAPGCEWLDLAPFSS